MRYFFFVKSFDIFVNTGESQKAYIIAYETRLTEEPGTPPYSKQISSNSAIKVIVTGGKTIYAPKLGPLVYTSKEKNFQPIGKFIICSVTKEGTLLASFFSALLFRIFESASMLKILDLHIASDLSGGTLVSYI